MSYLKILEIEAFLLLKNTDSDIFQGAILAYLGETCELERESAPASEEDGR